MWRVHHSLNPLVSFQCLQEALSIEKDWRTISLCPKCQSHFPPLPKYRNFDVLTSSSSIKKLLNILLVCLWRPQTTSWEENEDKMPVISCGPFLLMTAERSIYLEQSSGRHLCHSEGLCLIHTRSLHSFRFLHLLDLSKQAFSYIFHTGLSETNFCAKHSPFKKDLWIICFADSSLARLYANSLTFTDLT